MEATTEKNEYNLKDFVESFCKIQDKYKETGF